MKNVENELKELNKKAPQNAKYSVLRGIPLPAAGSNPHGAVCLSS